MPANDIQIGGDHYKRRGEVQHWDTMCDLNVPYVIGCATKYVSRWRSKNGLQDLEKAIHYLDKFIERSIVLCLHWHYYYSPVSHATITNWTDGKKEATICELLLNLGGLRAEHACDHARLAQTLIRELIAEYVAGYEEQPTASQLHPR